MLRVPRLLVALFLLPCLLFAQKLKKADKAMVANLEAHISFLASDKLEGRRAGTNGEKLAREYITAQWYKAGLQPKGTANSWLQPFDINDGLQVNPGTLFLVNGHDLKLNEDFFPLACSPNASLEAAVSMALAENGVPWFFDVKELLEENKNNPHFDLEEAIKAKATKAAAKSATAFIVYNSSAVSDGLSFNGKDRSEKTPIPILFVTAQGKKTYLKDESGMLDIRIKTDIGSKKRTGNNVIGYIDNGAATTIILGAHYDHLGYGEDGNSLLRTAGPLQVHNGADDNASGTAALLELAPLLKQSKFKNNNYLFIAFSAEELGLNGSTYFTEHATVDLSRVNYMINMDMIGRLNDSSKVLTIGGYGTSPLWGQLLPPLVPKKTFTVKYDSSGSGPSDHTSFYRKDIPVLFFFTGLHSDYHRPSDDFNKINYTGEWQVIKYIESIIQATNNKGKLAFAKTRETQTSTATRFSVTLGIMPDYTFSGTGIRVDGISDDRPAKKAGLKAGDIITRLGDFNTASMEGYMQALSNFKKGDSTTVTFKRGNEVQTAAIRF